MKVKLNYKDCVKEVIERNPKNVFQTLKIISELAKKNNWDKHGINRMQVFFVVCDKLDINDRDLRDK